MKRIEYPQILIFVGVLITLIFSACAPAPTPGTPIVVTEVVEKVIEKEVEKVVTSTPEPVTIKFQSFTINDLPPITAELIQEFEETHPNIKIEISSTDYQAPYQQVIMETRAGNPPDVWELWNDYQAAQDGFAFNLDSFVEKEGGEDFTNQYFDILIERSTYEGSVHTVPWRGGAIIMYINDTLLEKAGLEPPPEDWDWDMFLDYAKKMTDPAAGEYGYGISGSAASTETDWQFMSWVFTAGGDQVEEHRAVFNSPEGVEAMQWIVDLIYKHEVTPPGVASQTINDVVTMFGEGKLGMFFDGPWFMPNIKARYPDLKFHVQILPRYRSTGSCAGGTSLALHTGSQYKDEAWEFIKFMTSPDAVCRWAIELESIPSHLDCDDPVLQGPMLSVVLKAMGMPTTRSYEQYPETSRVTQVISQYVQAAYLQELSPEEALDAAVSELNAIWEQYFP